MKCAITTLLLTIHLFCFSQSKTKTAIDSTSNSTIIKQVELGEGKKGLDKFFKNRDLKIKFDQNEWLKHNDDSNFESPRWNMLTDLKENYLNSKLNKVQIINLLGDPFEVEERETKSKKKKLNLMLYPVGAYSGLGFDIDFLVISLDKNGKMIAFWIEQH